MGKQKDAINAKILKDVKFPMMLDTFDLCTSELQEKLVSMRTKFKDYEDFIVGQVGSVKAKGGKEAALKKQQEDDEKKEMFPYWFEVDLGSNNSGYYELQAVLTHKGRSSNSGHYVAWTRYKGESWIECNDDTINPIHVEDVMKLSGGGDWHTAYILLYGPRKLMKYEKENKEESEKASENMEATSGDSKEEQKMETS